MNTNKKIVAVALLFGTCVAASCSKDPEVAKREYVRSGDAYVAEKKYKEAVIEYRNAVQQDPLFGEARFKLAETYAQEKNVTGAYGEYIRAADLLPDDVQAQVKAARMLLLARQWDDAQARADRALALDPKNIDALIVKGNALAGLQNLDAAVDRIEEAIRLDPARTESYATLGAIELARGRREQAEGAFKKATEADPQSVPAWLALANFYWNTGQAAEVEQSLTKAISIDAKNVTAHRALAVFYIATRQPAKVESHLKTVVANSTDGRDKLTLADYYIATNRKEEARPILENLAKTDAEQLFGAKIRLASLAISAGNRAGGYQLIDEVLQTQPKNVDALIAKATMLLEDKKHDEALARVRDAVQADAKSATAQFALGRVHAARQEREPAIAAYNEVLKINPQLNAARVELMRLYVAQNKPEEALQFAQEALKYQPNSAEIAFLQNRAMMLKGDTAGAAPRVQQLAQAFPKSSSAQTQVGQLAMMKGDLPGARRAYEQALAVNPGDVEALGGLALLDFRAKNPAAARARIDARVSADAKDPGLLLLAARVYATAGDTGASERMLRKVIEVDPAQLDAYGMLGRLYASQGRLDDARTEFERLAAMRPANAVGAHTVIALILQMQKKDAEARARYEKVLALDPRAAVAANNLAWIYAETGGNLDLALQLAQTAKSQLTDRPEVNDTLGWVYYKKGLATLAVSPFQQSIEKDPKNPMYHYHLGLAYTKTGDKDGARKALEQALQLNPKFEGAADAQRALAEIKG